MLSIKKSSERLNLILMENSMTPTEFAHTYDASRSCTMPQTPGLLPQTTAKPPEKTSSPKALIPFNPIAMIL